MSAMVACAVFGGYQWSAAETRVYRGEKLWSCIVGMYDVISALKWQQLSDDSGMIYFISYIGFINIDIFLSEIPFERGLCPVKQEKISVYAMIIQTRQKICHKFFGSSGTKRCYHMQYFHNP